MAIYKNILEGTFIERPNRFIAIVNIEGKEEICHVKNTGRCKELLLPGAKVYLEKSANPKRKTVYDLVAVVKKCNLNERLINMDSQIPNAVAYEWIKKGGLGKIPELLKKEVKFGNSRFDVYGEFEGKKTFIEVKGVTLENEGVVCFPDAPTERGIKHIYELMECIKSEFDAYIIFVVQMCNVKYFEPNDKTQPQFREALQKAMKAGVKIIALECEVKPDMIVAKKQIEVKI